MNEKKREGERERKKRRHKSHLKNIRAHFCAIQMFVHKKQVKVESFLMRCQDV